MYKRKIMEHISRSAMDHPTRGLNMPTFTSQATTVLGLLQDTPELFVDEYENFFDSYVNATKKWKSLGVPSIKFPLEKDSVLVTFTSNLSKKQVKKITLEDEGFYNGKSVHAVLVKRNNESTRVYSFEQIDLGNDGKRWCYLPVYSDIDNNVNGKAVCFCMDQRMGSEIFEYLKRYHAMSMCLLIYALQVVACGNVVTRYVPPIGHSGKNHKKQAGASEDGYHEMCFKRRIEDDHILEKVALCHGHIKTYTAEKPLLGKHVGSWWWQDHVRKV